jgi:hypothetical protein
MPIIQPNTFKWWAESEKPTKKRQRTDALTELSSGVGLNVVLLPDGRWRQIGGRTDNDVCNHSVDPTHVNGSQTETVVIVRDAEALNGHARDGLLVGAQASRQQAMRGWGGLGHVNVDIAARLSAMTYGQMQQ